MGLECVTLSRNPKGRIKGGNSWNCWRKRNSRLNLLQVKVMLTVLRNVNGSLLEHHLEEELALTGEGNSEILASKMNPSICNKRRRL